MDDWTDRIGQDRRPLIILPTGEAAEQRGIRAVGSAHAFFRRPEAIAVRPTAGSSFRFPPPDTGKSNDGWRRSSRALVRFSCLFAPPPFAGVSRARLRFKAEIRWITGGGALTQIAGPRLDGAVSTGRSPALGM